MIFISVVGTVYCISGYYNVLRGMDFAVSFSPYYVFHVDDVVNMLTGILFAGMMTANHLANRMYESLELIQAKWDRYYFDTVEPFLIQHSVATFLLSITLGILTSSVFIWITFFLISQTAQVLSNGGILLLRPPSRAAKNRLEKWVYDPARQPSLEQIRESQKQLEKLFQRTMAMNGIPPRNTDINTRLQARRARKHGYIYRNAIYVMGPIKGTKLDQYYPMPLKLDQVRRLCSMIGRASVYETLPLDLVVLRSRKGSEVWEIEPSIQPVQVGSRYSIKSIEKAMMHCRHTFIWNENAAKTIIGYGGVTKNRV